MKPHHVLPIAVLFALTFSPASLAQEEEDAEKPKEEKKLHPLEEAKEKLGEKFEEIRLASEKSEGLFDYYRDKRDGTVYLAVEPKQLGKEYVYFSHTVDGIASVGQFRGRFGYEQVLAIERHFDKIDFTARNHALYFDPENAISRAADANVSDAILASAPILAQDPKKGTLLIEADGIFLKELMHQVKPSETKKDAERDAFRLGKLSEERTKFTKLGNYPENTAFTVSYVYEDLHPKKYAEEPDVTDSRFVTIEVQHTLIAMPDNDYHPRYDDPRVGFFNTQVTDMTSTSHVPYRDLIHRWKLVPKDPEAEVSEPVEPITWWIENTTPVELRTTIRDAALAWNQAFEAAGWKNALVIKQQPDDASWNAGDIRYNVLRWTSSPNPRFGGYGPSFVNPRTGEILGADIMLEWVFLTNRVRYSQMFGSEDSPANFGPRRLAHRHCAIGNCLHHANLFGKSAIRLTGLGKIEEDRLMKEALYYLVLHELGHTLGLGHNFKASQLHDPAKIFDRQLTERVGLTASVMEYPAINVAPPEKEQGQYYQTNPGPYDTWAIQFGYSRKLDDADELEAHLALSASQPGLDYANDADDMRSPGKGIDPRAMLGDMSSDGIAYGIQRMDLVKSLMADLVQTAVEPELSFQSVTDQWESLLWQYSGQLNAIARYVGGVHVQRALAGQPRTQNPLSPVPAETQRQALETLAQYAFAPDAFDWDAELLQHLQTQRRGWDFEADGEDPKVLDQILQTQNAVLDHLLHKNTVSRILNTELYGNEVPLSEVFDSLTNAVFILERDSEPNSIRQSLQRTYVERLITIAGVENDSSFPQPARANAFGQLESIAQQVRPISNPHLRQIQLRIERALRGD